LNRVSRSTYAGKKPPPSGNSAASASLIAGHLVVMWRPRIWIRWGSSDLRSRSHCTGHGFAWISGCSGSVRNGSHRLILGRCQLPRASDGVPLRHPASCPPRRPPVLRSEGGGMPAGPPKDALFRRPRASRARVPWRLLFPALPSLAVLGYARGPPRSAGRSADPDLQHRRVLRVRSGSRVFPYPPCCSSTSDPGISCPCPTPLTSNVCPYVCVLRLRSSSV